MKAAAARIATKAIEPTTPPAMAPAFGVFTFKDWINGVWDDSLRVVVEGDIGAELVVSSGMGVGVDGGGGGGGVGVGTRGVGVTGSIR